MANIHDENLVTIQDESDALIQDEGGGTVEFYPAVIADSTTSAVINLDIIRKFTADVAGDSLTTDINLELGAVTIEFIADVIGESLTTAISINFVRSIVADVFGDSLINPINLLVLRPIVSDVIGDSLTTDIDLNITGILQVIADVVGDSLTSDIALNLYVLGTILNPSIREIEEIKTIVDAFDTNTIISSI